MSSIKYKNGSGNWEDVSNTGLAATTTTYGVVKLATSEEAAEGTDDKKVITPKTLNEITSGINSDLEQEISDRQEADEILQSNIDTVASNLETETSNRQSGDTTLQNNIDTVSINLETETSNRQSGDEELNTKITNHTNRKDNPHEVTKAQVGLGNVDNTSDVDKPISTATQSALDQKANDSEVVHIAGSETITGTKTFTSTDGILVKGDDNFSTVTESKDDNILRGLDSAGKLVNALYSFREYSATSGESRTGIWQRAFNLTDSSSYADIRNMISDNGKAKLTYSTHNATNLNLTASTADTENVLIATMGWVNNPETSLNVVHRTSNETINGTKTFTTHPVIKTTEADARIITQFDDLTMGTAPSTNHFAGFLTEDKDGKQFANCNCSYKTNGVIGSNFYVEKQIDDTTVSGTLGVFIDASNNVYTQAPNPPADDNSTKIATTSWVKSTISGDTNVVHRTGDETISGTKTFTTNPIISKTGEATLIMKNTSINGIDPVSSSTYTNTIASYASGYNISNIRVKRDNGYNQITNNIRNYSDSTKHIQSYFYVNGYDDGSGELSFKVDANGSGDTRTPVNKSLSTASSSTSDTMIPTKGWVNNPSTATNVVHRNGTETISGQKTFTANPIVKTNTPTLVLMDTNYTKGTTATTDEYEGLLHYRDKDGKDLIADYNYIPKDTNYTQYIKRLYKNTSNSDTTYVDAITASNMGTSSILKIGTTTATTPTPTEDTTTSVQIDTVGARNSKISSVTGPMATNITNLQTAVGTLSNLTTDAKNNLVAAINEIDSHTDTNTNDISTINSKISSDATSSNKLVDKQYVDTAIATNAASFDGNWNTYALIPTTVAGFTSEGLPEPTNNNYLIVKNDETQDGGTWRYKYTPGTATTYSKSYWQAEYEINESPLTPAQQAALDSGITDTLVAQIGTNQSDISTLSTNKADDNNVVHKTGDETINGTKTFKNSLILNKSEPIVCMQDTRITKGTAPESSQTTFHSVTYDKNGLLHTNKLSQIYHSYYTAGGSALVMDLMKPESGSTKIAGSLFINYNTDNSVISGLNCDSTITNKNITLATNSTTSNYLATMGWVNNPATSTNVVHRTADEIITGQKTFNNAPKFRNNLTNSLSVTATEEQVLINTSANTDNVIDGMSVVRSVKYNASGNNSRYVQYRAGFRKADNSGNLWPSMNVGVDENEKKFVDLSVDYATSPTPTDNNTTSKQIDTVGARNTALGNKVDKVSTASKLYGTDASGNQTTYDKDSLIYLTGVQVNGTSVVSNKVANIQSDGTTISSNSSNKLQAIGLIDKKSGNAIYDWVGTSAEYNAAKTAGTIQPSWVCYITDDAETELQWGSITGSISNQPDLVAFVTSSAGLPGQAGQSGKYLRTNGNAAYWDTVDALPSQSGQNGNVLTTNGTTASWISPTTLFNVDGKLDKVTTTTTYDQSYVKLANGNQTTYNIVAASAVGDSIARRTSTGTIRVATPTDNNDAVNLSKLNSTLTAYQTTANMDSSLSSSTSKYPSSAAVKAITDTLATDSDVVHISTVETISGAKTYTANNVYQNTSVVPTYKNTAYERGTAPTNDTYIYQFKGVDKNGKNLIIDYNMIKKDSNTPYYIKRLYDSTSASATASRDVITAWYNGTTSNITFGTHTANAPTPSTTTSTSDTYIATTGWVNTRKQDKLGTSQLNAVNSGITSTLVGKITTNETDIGVLDGRVDTLEANETNYQLKNNIEQSLSTSTTKYPSSNAVKTAIENIDALPSQSGNNGKFLTTNGSAASWATIHQMSVSYDSTNSRLIFS